MSLSAQSVKAGAQKIKANVAKIEAGAVKGDRSKADNRLATRANGISPKSASVEVGSRSVNRVRRAPENGVYSWDFEDASQFSDWTIIDNDGDGFNWEYFNNTGLTTDRMTAHEGEGLVASASYDKESGSALNPDNWLISPEITLGGALTLWACGQDESYASEVFGVYVCVSDPSNINNYEQVGSNVTATGEYVKYKFDLSAYAGQTGRFAIRHYNVSDMFWLNIDDVTLDLNLLPDPTVPTNLTVAPGATTADVTWEDTDDEAWNLRYREVDLSNLAMVTLTADDVWGDGTGYQMLLDADATAYGTIIPESGALTSSGNADASVYGAFEYKIPTNADGVLSTSNIIINKSVTIFIPAGTYDWCITNPTPGDRVWIASANGNVSGRQDDYEFEANKVYEFHVSLGGSNDRVDVTITDVVGSGDSDATAWTTVNDVDSPYNLTALSPETLYEVQVQGDCGDGQSEWISKYFVTLPACPTPSNVTVEPGVATANVTWEGYSDSYNLRYRTAGTPIFAENWENGEINSWTGYNLHDNSGLAYDSENQDNICFGFYYTENPPQYLISPKLSGVKAGMKLEFRYMVRSSNYPESFRVGYSSTTNDVSDFTWGDEITTDATTYQLFSETIPAGTKYFCVQCTSYDQYVLYVDDFIVIGEEEIPAGEWITIEGIEENEYEITGLEPDTRYEVQVQGVCDETETAWSEIEPFATLEALVLLNDDLAEEVQNSDKLTEAVSASGTLVNVMLKDRTFFKDGNWNTLCLPFSVSEDEIANSPLAGANIKKFYDGNVTGTHVDIVFTDATDIEAGEYYIFKWDEGEDISNPAFKNVEIVINDSYHYDYRDGSYFKVYGNFSSFEVDPSVDGCYTYYLTSNGELKYSDKYRVLKTFRIFFRFTADNDAAGALDFNLVFDDGSTQTGIVELDGNGRDNRALEGYYNLQGVKYNGKPIQKGVYINNGRKVVVK